MDMVNYMLLSLGAPENLRGEALFSASSFAIRFPKERLMLLPMKVEKRELLTSNSSKFGVVWIMFQ